MSSVIKGAGYVLMFAPDMVLHNGTTQTTEKLVNPGSDYLKKLPLHLRTYQQVLAYPPNQVYIGNLRPEDLSSISLPWYQHEEENPRRYGPFGEIMPQDEFIMMLQVCDAFDLVRLEEGFASRTIEKLAKNPLITKAIVQMAKPGVPEGQIRQLVESEGAEALYHMHTLVGCVRRAHDIDINLSAHVMLENLAAKAGSVLALLHMAGSTGIDPLEIEYVIDSSEEACGDMNQRGGGNFAKAAAEIAGFANAAGADMRSFCAGPAHAIVTAAALVKAGVYRNVAVTAGGATAKLGMNGKDHVKNGMPILEDVLGGFAVLIGEDDGFSPEINLNAVGRHTVNTGSSPQAVITSLVSLPLRQNGLKITDVDKYSPEMQNPEVTKPAGAGDVPLSNYKMIGALAVKEGQISRADLAAFPEQYGFVGWAPTQGHIPSGIPYLGFARQDILEGKISRAMIIGKGSLFLGRMTNQFDGISFLLQKNTGDKDYSGEVSREMVRGMIAGALEDLARTLLGEEDKAHGS